MQELKSLQDQKNQIQREKNSDKSSIGIWAKTINICIFKVDKDMDKLGIVCEAANPVTRLPAVIKH